MDLLGDPFVIEETTVIDTKTLARLVNGVRKNTR
jgi:hypothetical protein